MKYYIYAYTNKINNKQYIGQTKNIKNRQRHHKQSLYNNYNTRDYSQSIHCAMREYGIENFDFEIIEEIETDNKKIVNEKESYWIKKKNTFAPNGYNMSAAKISSDIITKSKIDKETIDNIFKDLKQNMTLKQIAEKYNLSISFISDINRGNRLWRETEKYPIKNNSIDDNYYLNIIDMLLNTKLSIRKIAQNLGLNITTIQNVNNGKQKRVRKLWKEDFPIRKNPRNNYNLDRVETK